MSKLSQEEQDALLKEMMGTQRPTFAIKTVSINTDTVDNNNKEVPPNTFHAWGTDLYAKEVLVRPLMFLSKYVNTQQVIEKGAKKWRTVSETILHGMGEEALDTMGGVKCGKITGKAVPGHWTEAQRAANQAKAKFNGHLFGIFHFPKAEPFLAQIKLPSAKAMSVGEQLGYKTIADGKAMAMYMLKLTLTPKKGSNHPEMAALLDTKKELPIHEVYDEFKEVKRYVKFHNEKIMRIRSQVANAALMKTQDDETLDDVLATLGEDFNDE